MKNFGDTGFFLACCPVRSLEGFQDLFKEKMGKPLPKVLFRSEEPSSTWRGTPRFAYPRFQDEHKRLPRA